MQVAMSPKFSQAESTGRLAALGLDAEIIAALRNNQVAVKKVLTKQELIDLTDLNPINDLTGWIIAANGVYLVKGAIHFIATPITGLKIYLNVPETISKCGSGGYILNEEGAMVVLAAQDQQTVIPLPPYHSKS